MKVSFIHLLLIAVILGTFPHSVSGNEIESGRSISQPEPDTSNVHEAALINQTDSYHKLFAQLKSLAGQQVMPAGRLITLQSKPLYVSLKDSETETDIEIRSEIGAGVWLTVMERQPGGLRIQLDGWVQDGISHLVYALPGKRILVAKLNERMQNSVRHISNTITPDSDQIWHLVTLEGWVTRGDLIPDDKQLWNYASQIHKQTCAMCHPLPVTDHLSANGWLARLKAMKLNTNLQREEYLILLRYLQLNASDMSIESAD